MTNLKLHQSRTPLFNLNGRTITLTDDGILLKRRALEMPDLIEVPGEETSNEGCEAVSAEDYGKLK